MAKAQLAFACRDCGGTTPKWQGQCPGCGAWNTLEPSLRPRADRGTSRAAQVQRLGDLDAGAAPRMPTGIGELDRVLGGGLVPGAVVLIGGAPGIGKSTLLLQVAGRGRAEWTTLYASGEESPAQIALRARRLGLEPAAANVLATTSVEEVIAAAQALNAACLIVDSIQTMCTEAVPAAAGSPNQLRESTARLIQVAKTTGLAVMLVGHVTKEGLIAGPRMLEHMVDAVLYFEDEAGSRFRMLRAVKNRFGAAHELGVFAMTDQGLREVRNPSAMLLSRQDEPVPGSVVTALYQGTRPLLVEVQALTDRAGAGPVRRLAVGLDPNRLALLLAALHRHAGIRCHEEDVFVNVVGGVRVSDTAADLAVLAAVASGSLGRPVARDTVIFGEVGLGGEIRPVAYGEDRLREAAKLGFARAIVPRANVPRRAPEGLCSQGVVKLSEALQALRERD